MQAWWRVLRGAWPYRMAVVISMLCALGVGFSYAAGVGVLLPVLKIFISVEGIHGWANRTVAGNRLDVGLLDLDGIVQRNERPQRGLPAERPRGDQLCLIIANSGKNAPPALQITKERTSIFVLSVKGTVPRQLIDQHKWGELVRKLDQSPDGSLITVESQNWQAMVGILAHAQNGTTLTADIGDAKPVEIIAQPLPWHMRTFLLVDLLPMDPTQALIYVVLFFIFLCFVGSVFRYYQQFIGMNVANRVVMDLRRRAYDRVVQLPTSYFAQKGTADLMSRLTQDTNTLTDGVSMALGKAIQEPIKAVFAAAVAFYFDWRLCLGVIAVTPILGLIIRKFSKRMRRASRGALENWSLMLGVINETLIGARVVKAYSAEGYERRRFARVNKAILKEQIKLNHYGSLSRPTIETLAVILSSIPIVIAAHLVFIHKIDKEILMTLLACFVAMLEPMRKLSDVNSKVQQTNAAATRIFEMIDMDPEPNYAPTLPKLPRHSKTIEFRHVTFNYPGHTETVLNDVNFTVQHGQLIAVVGGNGSGKTTLLQLLPRLYMPTTGQILIDGIDIDTTSLRSLRKQIGLVTQDTLLFADTIYNNISYGSRHATADEIHDAARRAFADDFILGLAEGYQTRVGEHGVRLSGGQKQRLAIARAILHDPAILILDEAMSQIDSDSEAKISEALRTFMKNRTTFMIAHRFQTVINADLIVCLDIGQVAGIGNHHQLLANCPAYRKLYETQFREAAEEREAVIAAK